MGKINMPVPSLHKHAASDIDSGTLAMERGGTNASNRSGAFSNLTFIGREPIVSTDDDTVENWASLGSGYCLYSEGGYLTDQPSTYGWLINYAHGASTIYQLWLGRPGGSIYARGGNSIGWASTWKKIFDDSQIIPVVNGGTGAASFASGAALIGNGTAAIDTRAIKHLSEADTVTINSDLVTAATLAYFTRYYLNRENKVNIANTSYGTYMGRGIALVTSVPTSMANGTCAFVY